MGLAEWPLKHNCENVSLHSVSVTLTALMDPETVCVCACAVGMCLLVCVHMRVFVFVCVCVRARVPVQVWALVKSSALYMEKGAIWAACQRDAHILLL